MEMLTSSGGLTGLGEIKQRKLRGVVPSPNCPSPLLQKVSLPVVLMERHRESDLQSRGESRGQTRKITPPWK